MKRKKPIITELFSSTFYKYVQGLPTVFTFILLWSLSTDGASLMHIVNFNLIQQGYMLNGTKAVAH